MGHRHNNPYQQHTPRHPFNINADTPGSSMSAQQPTHLFHGVRDPAGMASTVRAQGEKNIFLICFEKYFPGTVSLMLFGEKYFPQYIFSYSLNTAKQNTLLQGP